MDFLAYSPARAASHIRSRRDRQLKNVDQAMDFPARLKIKVGNVPRPPLIFAVDQYDSRSKLPGSIENLELFGSNLTTLELSNLPNLKSLSLFNSKMTSIDVFNLPVIVMTCAWNSIVKCEFR